MTMPQKSKPSRRPRSDEIGHGELESPRERHRRRLRETLAGVNLFFEKADEMVAGDWFRLMAASVALSEVIGFLYSELDVGEKDLIRPLLALHTAIGDVLEGGSPPLLHPPGFIGGGRPTSIARDRAQVALALALELLMAAGETGIAPAASWVADEARRAGLSDPYGSAVTAAQIIQWRKNIRAKRAPRGALEHWECQRHEHQELLAASPSDVKYERARRAAAQIVNVLALIAPRSAPTLSHKSQNTRSNKKVQKPPS
jgi:hypothetical protein